jgi:FkbM family methyltransferase
MSITPRALRRAVGPWLPEPMKRSLRAKLFGYTGSHGRLAVRFEEDAHGPFATIDDRIALRYRVEDAGDFAYQFRDNGDSVDEMAGFLRCARDARTFVDVGAWKGLFSLLFCSLHPDNRAVAYEPSPAGQHAIRALASANAISSIAVRTVAVGASPSRVPGRRAPNGTFAVAGDDSDGAAIGDLDVVSLDEDLQALDVTPDLVKIDVEGYEYEVLVGARRLLSRSRPIVCLELHLDVLERRGVSPSTVLDELALRGYGFENAAGAPLTPSQICGSAHAILRFIAR